MPINKKGYSTKLDTSSNKLSEGLKYNPIFLVSFLPNLRIVSFRACGLIKTLAFNKFSNNFLYLIF